MEIQSKNPKETQKIAAILAEEILRFRPAKGALVLALTGELGSGKTNFTQGLAKGLGIKTRVKSPSFLLLREYPIPRTKKKLVHLDCYRLAGQKDLATIDFADFLSDPQNIMVVEWADKIKKSLPKKNILWLKFRHKEKNQRRISVGNF